MITLDQATFSINNFIVIKSSKILLLFSAYLILLQLLNTNLIW